MISGGGKGGEGSARGANAPRPPLNACECTVHAVVWLQNVYVHVHAVVRVCMCTCICV